MLKEGKPNPEAQARLRVFYHAKPEVKNSYLIYSQQDRSRL